jgi:hypothetical protein
MAKATPTKKQAEAPDTVSGYFRRIMTENRKLLKARSNDELVRRWQADHPGEEFTPKLRAVLMNVKSVMRHKKHNRRARKAGQPQEAAAAAHELPKPSKPSHKLEALEEQIDDCLSLAKTLDREGLEDVIKLLRHARNKVVWTMGQ